MAWTAPTTFVAGNVLTAAQLNAFGADLSFLHDPPRCCVTRSSTISVPTATSTLFTFDTENWDNDGMHSTVSNTSRVTATTGGLYVAVASIDWAGVAAATRRQAIIRLTQGGGGIINLAVDERQSYPSAAVHTQYAAVAIPWTWAAGDYAEVIVYHEAGAAVSCQVVLSVARVGGP